MIALHLMEEAPVLFSSNILPEHRNDPVIEMEENMSETAIIEYLDEELLAEADRYVSVAEESTSIPGIQALQVAQLRTVALKLLNQQLFDKESRKKRRSTEKRTQTQNEQIFETKCHHERKIAKVKESHLNVSIQMTEEHLAKMHELQIRKATAEAELVKWKLARAKENIA